MMHAGRKSAAVTFSTVAMILSSCTSILFFCGSNFGASAFQSPPSLAKTTRTIKLPRNRGTTNLYAFEGAVASIDAFYHSQPFLSAFVTCGFKASAADLLAQSSAGTNEEGEEESKKIPEAAASSAMVAKSVEKDDDEINVNRNFAFLLYGGLYQGMFLQFLYSVLFPFLYGDSEYRVVLQVLTDILIFGPFLTLPIAYVIKQFLAAAGDVNDNDGEDIAILEIFEKGIDKYKNHIETQGILFKYWSIWAPAQTLTFGVIPPHLRVVFVAFVSFFWVTILSDVSSREVTATTASND